MPWEIDSMTQWLVRLSDVFGWPLAQQDCNHLLTETGQIRVDSASVAEWFPLVLLLREITHAAPPQEPRVVLAAQAISNRLEVAELPLFAREAPVSRSRPPLTEIKLLKAFEASFEESTDMAAALSFIQSVKELQWFAKRTGLCHWVFWMWSLRQFSERLPIPVSREATQAFLDALGSFETTLEDLKTACEGMRESPKTIPEEPPRSKGESPSPFYVTAPALMKRLQSFLEESLSQTARFEKEMRWQASFESHSSASLGLATGPWQKTQNARRVPSNIEWAGEWVLKFQSRTPAFRHSRVPRNRFVLLILRTTEAMHVVFHMHIEYDIGKAQQILPETVQIREVLDHMEMDSSSSVGFEALQNLAHDCLEQYLARLDEETAKYRMKGS